jgi:hypothetical protein
LDRRIGEGWERRARRKNTGKIRSNLTKETDVQRQRTRGKKAMNR